MCLWCPHGVLSRHSEAATPSLTLVPCDNAVGLDLLPPLPEPDQRAQQEEASLGFTIVLVVVCLLVGITSAVAFFAKEMPLLARWALPALIWSEAFAAFACFKGILHGDPGVIPRSPQHSLPFPPTVEKRVQEGTSFQGLPNFRAADGRSYCVRCFVWRPDNAHHCSTCGRCVVDFDHHCGVFGRCIAGSGLHGNMKYFTGLLVFGCCGGLTCATCATWGACLAWGILGLLVVFVVSVAIAWGVLSIWFDPFLIAEAVDCWRTCVRSGLERKDSLKMSLLGSGERS